MATIKSFEDLKVWQKARTLCQQVFEIIEQKKIKRLQVERPDKRIIWLCYG